MFYLLHWWNTIFFTRSSLNKEEFFTSATKKNIINRQLIKNSRCNCREFTLNMESKFYWNAPHQHQQLFHLLHFHRQGTRKRKIELEIYEQQRRDEKEGWWGRGWFVGTSCMFVSEQNEAASTHVVAAVNLNTGGDDVYIKRCSL